MAKLNINGLIISSNGDNKQINTYDLAYHKKTIKDINSIPDTNDGDVVYVSGYHDVNDQGGGKFVWDPSVPRNQHNGGTILSPAKQFPVDWSNLDEQNEWYSPDSSGNTGCWVKEIKNNIVSLSEFGFTGSEELAVWNATNTPYTVVAKPGDYTLSSNDKNFDNKKIFVLGDGDLSFSALDSSNNKIKIPGLDATKMGGDVSEYKAKAPVLTFSFDTINEYDSANFSVQIEADQTLRVWADNGDVEKVSADSSGYYTFSYTAPTNITADITDTIYAVALQPGYLVSDTVSKEIKVIYVEMQTDASLINSDFEQNGYNEKGISYE